MEKIHVHARLEIKEGKLAEFKSIAEQAAAMVREKDTGTECYDWYLNEDESVCVVRETYRDSEAVLEHIEHVGALLGQLAEVSEIRIDVFGRPSEELVKVGEPFGQVVYTPLLSL